MTFDEWYKPNEMENFNLTSDRDRFIWNAATETAIRQVCMWNKNKNIMDTERGISRLTSLCNPRPNYCPYCGGEIEVKK